MATSAFSVPPSSFHPNSVREREVALPSTRGREKLQPAASLGQQKLKLFMQTESHREVDNCAQNTERDGDMSPGTLSLTDRPLAADLS